MLEKAVLLSIFRYKVFIMIKLEDLKYINSVDKSFGDFTVNIIAESVNVLFDEIKEKEDMVLDNETLNEIEAFYTAAVDIMEESEMYEECVKAYYILESVKIQKKIIKK